MDDDKIMALMVKVDPMTRRIPEGIRAIAHAIEAAERERCIYWCEIGDHEGWATHHIREGTPIGGA